MIDIDKSKVLQLKELLDDMQYHLIMTITLGEQNYFVNPLLDYNTIKKEVQKLDEKYIKLISFFSLGEPIEKAFLLRYLDVSVVDHLVELEIVNMDETDVWMNNLLLTSYNNCYFLVSNVFYYPTNQSFEQKPYIGIDTYWLSRIIVNRLKGTVLDLCTGSGIQGILAAKTADYVLAVDIDPITVSIARFNTFLNDVDSKMEVKQGDLYFAVDEGVKFDYILSNPPFIPIPINVDFPICGDGGEDGMQIIRRIVKGYSNYLKCNGEGIMIGQTIGNKDQVFLSKELEKLLPGYSTKLIINGKSIIENQAHSFSDLANIVGKNNDIAANEKMWIDIYKKMNAEYFYNFTLFAKNNDQNENIVIKVDDNWNKDDVPISNVASIDKINEMYMMRSTDGNGNFSIDEETLFFIDSINGEKTVKELVENIPFRYKIKYGKNAHNVILMKYLSLCSMYERYGILFKSQNK